MKNIFPSSSDCIKLCVCVFVYSFVSTDVEVIPVLRFRRQTKNRLFYPFWHYVFHDIRFTLAHCSAATNAFFLCEERSTFSKNAPISSSSLLPIYLSELLFAFFFIPCVCPSSARVLCTRAACFILLL